MILMLSNSLDLEGGNKWGMMNPAPELMLRIGGGRRGRWCNPGRVLRL